MAKGFVMPDYSIRLQTLHILGHHQGPWHHIDAADFERLCLPDHLRDQVFRILFTAIGQDLYFEVLVSEQCPKDVFTRVARALRRLGPKSGVACILHTRSANAHLVFWHHRSQDSFHHLDLDFNHLSEFDHQIIENFRIEGAGSFQHIFQALAGRDLRHSFFKILQKQLAKIQAREKPGYHTLVHLLLRLIFLIFVQRKGWLNFDPFFLENKMALCQAKGLSIQTCLIKPLFTRLEGQRCREFIPFGELPLLGGGLFQYPTEKLPLIPNDWFTELYQTLSHQFSFSLFESKAGRNILGISPEVLGHVFENLLLPKERSIQGTYYTPMHVAEKQANASIKAWLKTRDAVDPGTKRDQLLRDIRILDPSCGSGSYLVAALSVLLRCRLEHAPEKERYNGHLYALKSQIVTRNLFGMDINPMAVKLAEVRLWLYMIQDLEIAQPSLAPPLPNLQHHLRPGDFLGSQWPADLARFRDWPKHKKLKELRDKFPLSTPDKRIVYLQHIFRLEKELTLFLFEHERKKAYAVTRQEMAQDHLPGHEDFRTKPKLPSKVKEPNQHIHVMFTRTMMDGGFDLILGNPPWLSSTKIPARMKNRILSRLQLPVGLQLHGQIDLSLYFTTQALYLLKEGGQLGFLLPGKILQAKFAKGLRHYLAHHCRIDYLFDYGLRQGLLFQADTFPVALGITKKKADHRHHLLIERHGPSLFESEEIAQSKFLGAYWPVFSEPRQVRQDGNWVRLDALGQIKRGIVTGAKSQFVFKNLPEHIDPNNLRPLLCGRDIEQEKVGPSHWIYWPFDHGARWYDCLQPQERNWLCQLKKVVVSPSKIQLPYIPRPFGAWLVVWKYLASTWTATLIDARLGWIPDQTTYYISCKTKQQAFAIFRQINQPSIMNQVRNRAERGKDGCYFFYAHTCAGIQLCHSAPTNVPRGSMLLPNQAQENEAAHDSSC